MIGRKNLPLNPHTRICSKHFVNAEGRRLYLSEVPSLFLPRTSISWNKSRRKPPRDRSMFLSNLDEAFEAEDLEEDEEGQMKDMATQTEMNKEQVEELLTVQKKVATLEKQLEEANKGYFLHWLFVFLYFESML